MKQTVIFLNKYLIYFSDFQTFVINTLTHIKYDISGLVDVNQITQANVQVLMDNIQTKSLSTPISADIFDTEYFLPVTNQHKFLAIWNKIQDTDFRMSLVSVIIYNLLDTVCN